jgi:hypothetical protein
VAQIWFKALYEYNKYFYIKDADVDSNKLIKFQMLLESKLLHLEDLKKLSWSGVPVEVRPKTWRLLAVSWLSL